MISKVNLLSMDAHLPIDMPQPVGAAALVAAAGAAIPLATNFPLVSAALATGAATATAPVTSTSVDGKTDTKKQHSELQKWAIVAECLCNYDWKKERLRDNAAAEIGEKYDFSKRQIERILKSYFTQREEGNLYPDFKRKMRCDKKRKRGPQGFHYKGDMPVFGGPGKPSNEFDDEDTDSQPEML